MRATYQFNLLHFEVRHFTESFEMIYPKRLALALILSQALYLATCLPVKTEGERIPDNTKLTTAGPSKAQQQPNQEINFAALNKFADVFSESESSAPPQTKVAVPDPKTIQDQKLAATVKASANKKYEEQRQAGMARAEAGKFEGGKDSRLTQDHLAAMKANKAAAAGRPTPH